MPADRWVGIDMGAGAYFMTVKGGPSGLIVVGSDLSGAYISRDRGSNWTCIGAEQGLTICHVSAIGFDPNDASVIVLGGTGGLFRSGNAGQTFTQVRTGGYFTDVTFARSDSRVAYAAGDPASSGYTKTTSKVFKSQDNGRSWTELNSPARLKVVKIVVHPQEPKTTYIVSEPHRFISKAPQALYRTMDGGKSWSKFATNIPGVIDFELNPTLPSEEMYVSAFDNPTGTYWKRPRASTDGIWKSVDGGRTWRKKSEHWGTVHVHSQQPKVIRVIGDYFVYESLDGGEAWKKKGDQGSWGKGAGLSWFYGTFDPNSHGNDLSDPESYYWVNSLWVNGTRDGGAHFHALYTRETPPKSNRWKNTGIKNTCVWDIQVSEANPRLVYAGFWDMGLWRSLDHGETWESCNNLLFSGNWTEPLVRGTKQGIGGNCRSITTDPVRANMVWATVGGDLGQALHLLRSTNSGRFDSWEEAGGIPKTSSVMGLSLDRQSPTNQRTLFCTAEGTVFRSTDDGLRWHAVFETNGCQYTQADRSNSRFVYAGGNGGFFRSIQHGAPASWRKVGIAEMTSVKAIACDPSNAGWVYVACYGDGRSNKGLYRSKDYGERWEKLLGDYFLRGVAIDPKNPKNLYAGSSSNESWGRYDARSKGVLFSRDGGATWNQANEGLSWPFAAVLQVDPGDSSVVFVGSPGLGFQKRRFMR